MKYKGMYVGLLQNKFCVELNGRLVQISADKHYLANI